MILTKHWAKRMGIDPPAAGKPASFTLLPGFRLSFIPDFYAGKFMISREWGIPFPRLCFLFPSRPGLPSTVYYNYSIFRRERYHVKPVIDTPQATPLIPNLPPMIRANTRFAPTPASGFSPILGANLVFARLRHFISSQPDRDILESPGRVTGNRAPVGAIAPMTLLMRRIKDNGGNGIDRVNRSPVITGHSGTVGGVTGNDMVHQPGTGHVDEVNGVLPAALEYRKMLFIFNRGGPPPGVDGNERTPSMASAPFMVMRPGSRTGVNLNAVNRDNVSYVTREHVRFADAEIENSREKSRVNVRENVRFYHVNNSRAGGGPGPGVPSPAPEPPRPGGHPASMTVPPDTGQPVIPGHLIHGDSGEIGNTKKIKIEQTDLDLEQFTHRVYGMLEQKIRLEKEMRGW